MRKSDDSTPLRQDYLALLLASVATNNEIDYVDVLETLTSPEYAACSTAEAQSLLGCDREDLLDSFYKALIKVIKSVADPDYMPPIVRYWANLSKGIHELKVGDWLSHDCYGLVIFRMNCDPQFEDGELNLRINKLKAVFQTFWSLEDMEEGIDFIAESECIFDRPSLINGIMDAVSENAYVQECIQEVRDCISGDTIEMIRKLAENKDVKWESSDDGAEGRYSHYENSHVASLQEYDIVYASDKSREMIHLIMDPQVVVLERTKDLNSWRKMLGEPRRLSITFETDDSNIEESDLSPEQLVRTLLKHGDKVKVSLSGADFIELLATWDKNEIEDKIKEPEPKKTSKEEPPSKEEEEEEPDLHIGLVDVIVRAPYTKCSKQRHDINPMKGLVNVLGYSGKVYETECTIIHCSTCDKYFMTDEEYERLKRRGRICCLITEEYEVASRNGDSRYSQWKDESILHQYGYNVGMKDNLSSQERQRILSFLIENDVQTPYEIIQFLQMQVRSREGNPSMGNAVSRWKTDINYLQHYKRAKGVATVRSIYRKKRI